MNAQKIFTGVLAVMLALAGMSAQEAPGRRFNELVDQINSAIERAREQTENLKKEKEKRSNEEAKATGEILDEREAAQKAVKDADAAYRANPSAENEEALRKAIIRFARGSADFLGRMKGDIDTDMGILDVLTKTLRFCINRLFDLEKLSESEREVTPEDTKARAAAKRSIVQLADIAEGLKTVPGADTRRLNQVLRTLDAQAARIIRARPGSSFDLSQVLKQQRGTYELVVAELEEARVRAQEQKDLVNQAIYHEIARTSLLKVSALLGGLDIEGAPQIFLARIDQRSDSLHRFFGQNQALDGNAGGSDTSSDSATPHIDRIRQDVD